MSESRNAAIAAAAAWFDAGALLADLRRRVGIRTESQNPQRAAELARYLTEEIGPAVERMGFRRTLWDNPVAGAPPMLFAERGEDPSLPTVLIYGHGDVVAGHDNQWSAGRSPWEVTEADGRWYGRGTADNKGQHTINLAALGQVQAARGRLGFNAKLLLEMGEEVGSPGLRRTCEARAESLRADVLIASDGPRLRSDRPTLFLGSRGAFNFDLVVDLREGAHHSGNWGGLLANPGVVLANAIASMIDARGRILVAGLRAPPIPRSVRRALEDIEPGEPDGPAIDGNWGEPGLTPAERVFGWNALEVLAFRTGNPDRPVNAIPPRANAHLQVRFVAGCDWRTFIPAIRTHLDLLRLRQGAGAAGGCRADGGHAPRSGPPVGALGGGVDRGHHGRAPRDPAEPRRVAAQRLLRRRARVADDLGAALLSRVLAARARRAPAGPRRARGSRNHDGALLGPGRAGQRSGAGARGPAGVTATGSAIFATIAARAGVAQW